MNKGLRFLIASGPTREPLDPVRYLSNYSTGTMGKYLVKAAKESHYQVEWVECPENVETAVELEAELMKLLPKTDVLVMAAAVCDVRPKKFSVSKIKKKDLDSISFVKNPDILANLSKVKRKGQVFVGFALESEDIFQNAFKKLSDKGLDLIVLQRVTKNKTPFGNKSIEAFILNKKKNIERHGEIKKENLAKLIVETAGKLAREAHRC